MRPAARPDSSLIPQAPDSLAIRRMLNGPDPFARGVAAAVRRLWLKQRPRQDADALLARVLEDLAGSRYFLEELEAYVQAMPLVAAPCWRLAEMIAEWNRPRREECPRA